MEQVVTLYLHLAKIHESLCWTNSWRYGNCEYKQVINAMLASMVAPQRTVSAVQVIRSFSWFPNLTLPS